MSLILDPKETERLLKYETAIEKGLQSFVQAGMALLSIRTEKLYREYYTSFEHYVQERWGFTGHRARQLINAFEIHETIESVTTVPVLPSTERQVRPLAPLDSAQQQKAWAQAVETANNNIPTTNQVQQAVIRVQEEASVIKETETVNNKRLRGITVAEWNSMSNDAKGVLLKEHEKETNSSVFNRTNDNVEWALWTWNPVTGCLHDCPYCYARDIANRFYPEKFEPVFHPWRLSAPQHTLLPEKAAETNVGEKNVFVCSMADLFGKWVPQGWIDAVLDTVRQHSQWNFLFLTKFPQKLSEQTFPDNAWVGTTVDRQHRVAVAEKAFANTKASVKWLSCEPLEERLDFSSLEMFDWIVLGGRSRSSQMPEFQPEWEWVEHLVEQARAANCMVYFKPNLKTRPREYPQ